MKIAIAGSGALGSGFGAKLFQAGYDVTLIDGYTSHVEAVKQHGLNITILSISKVYAIKRSDGRYEATY